MSIDPNRPYFSFSGGLCSLVHRVSLFLQSWRAGVVAAAGTVLIILGCMSISIGKFGTAPGEPECPFCQEGENSLAIGSERDIFYPVPFSNPPNLEISNDPLGRSEIVEQKEDHFRIRSRAEGFGTTTIRWKARGVRAPAVAPTALPPPLPPPEPPPASVSATGKSIPTN